MENASKALIIAGGILIAIVIIALLVKSFSTVSSFQKAQLSKEEQQQIRTFNEQYTKYLGQYVYGTEVASLKNRYENDRLVEVIIPEGIQLPTGIGQDVQYYKCTAIGYDNSTGRVNSITFRQVVIQEKIPN